MMVSCEFPTRSPLFGLALLSLFLVCSMAASQAKPYPGNNVIRIVVPTPPGPPPDVIGRLIAANLSEREGWRVVVDNRPGALQTLAMAEVMKQPADGLSIFLMSLGAIATPVFLPE